MAEELGTKTKKSLVWSIIDKVGSQFVGMLIGIITARLLCPDDFGVLGCLTIFTSISGFIIESGFGVAMLRKETVSREEYSAVFYFNVGISVVIYLLLFAFSPKIEDFFAIEHLAAYAQVLFLSLIVNALGIVQYINVRKNFLFRYLTYANLLSSIISGVVTIAMIKMGYGCWALVWQQLSMAIVKVLSLWLFNPFKLSLSPRFTVIRELFSYSSILTLNYLITTIASNVYNLILGKFYSVTDLGYYNHGRKYNDIITQVVVGSGISGVAAPSLAELNNDKTRQNFYLEKFLKLGFFIILPTLALLNVAIPDIVTLLFTDKWQPMVPYFRILSISGALFPMQNLYQQYFLMTGNKNIAFWVDMAKNALIIVSIVTCVFLFPNSPQNIVWSSVVAMVLATLIEMFYVNKLANYTFGAQIKAIIPIFLITAVMMTLIILASSQCENIIVRLLVEGMVALVAYFSLSWFFNRDFLTSLLSTFRK